MKEEISNWHGNKDNNQHGPPEKAGGMISCSRGTAKTRNVQHVCEKQCKAEGEEANPKKKPDIREEMTTKNMGARPWSTRELQIHVYKETTQRYQQPQCQLS